MAIPPSLLDLPPLSREEERTATKEELVLHNLRYAVARSSQFGVDGGMDDDDKFQIAVMGLVRAARDYDPERGNRFLTYATWWMRQHLRLAKSEAPIVRMPRDYVRTQEKAGKPVQFKSTATLDVDAMDSLTRSRTGCPREAVEHREHLAAVRKALRQLPVIEKTVIVLRFGIRCAENPDGETLTLAQVGARMGFTRSRAHQIEDRTKAKLTWLLRDAREEL